jgi:phosphoglycolate phosphatase-like HAD superfamily hydrolase
MILLVDIDHTLSDARWRDPLLLERPVDWDRYHTLSIQDKPIKGVVAMVNSLGIAGWYIVALTARPNRWRKVTMEWMGNVGVRVDEILMRDTEDYRPSPEVKQELLQNYTHRNVAPDNAVIIIDDREDVALFFKALGYTVLQVHAGRETP